MPANKPPFDGEWVKLNQLCTKGKSALRQKDLIDDGPYAVYGTSGIVGSMATFQNGARYVAVVKDGAGVGRANLCSARTSVLGTMQALIPTEMVLPEYLLHLIRAMRLGDGFSGSTIPHIYFKDYGQRLVRYVSMADQERIVGMLGSIEDQIDILNQRNERLDTLVKSRFVEMFGGSGWPVATVGSLATDIRYGTSKKASDCGQFVYLRMNNMTDGGGLDFGDVKHIDLSGAELEKCQVVDGDLLFNRTNSREKVGKTAVFHAKEPMVIAGYIIRVRLGDRIKPDFLAAYMNLPTTKAMLRSIARGAVHQANINSRELSAIEVPVPPICLQDSFLSFVAEVDKSRFNLLKAYGSIIALFRVLFP